MNFSFRPVNIKDISDQNLIKNFLADTQAIGGMILDDKEWDSYYSAIKRRQERSSDFCVFAVFGGEIVGLVDAFPRKDFPAIGFISFIYLVSEFRDQNFGKQLEEYAMTLFKKHKCSHAELDVHSKNLTALKFYEKNGWKIISEKNGFYRMGKEVSQE